ncbi:transcription factor MYB13-like [Olea europaea subsp. europaea]|uniref:Transcription factor MYB13-like n=1 Tax=Olea europaea subsp. europaea TaxID=158383 RepID=A0A8S0QJT4_OLEEU|nr:transcription factor MYB13-like [Olea europaea subsp. europaea]
MVKPCYVDGNGIKKGAWSEEDNKLREHIQSSGHSNWRLLPQCAGLARSGKSCRLRWVNYLKPGVKRGNYSKEEVDLIMGLHAKLGNKYGIILN